MWPRTTQQIFFSSFENKHGLDVFGQIKQILIFKTLLRAERSDGDQRPPHRNTYAKVQIWLIMHSIVMPAHARKLLRIGNYMHSNTNSSFGRFRERENDKGKSAASIFHKICEIIISGLCFESPFPIVSMRTRFAFISFSKRIIFGHFIALENLINEYFTSKALAGMTKMWQGVYWLEMRRKHATTLNRCVACAH